MSKIEEYEASKSARNMKIQSRSRLNRDNCH